jgi:hypothetical protein
MKKFAILLLVLVFAIPSFAQKITEDKAKESVKSILSKITTDYGKVDHDKGYYELEYKLVYNGKVVSEAEKKVKQAPNVKSGQLLLDFEKELKSKLTSASVESAKLDKDDNKWEVKLNVPGIDIGEINVDASTGEIVAD